MFYSCLFLFETLKKMWVTTSLINSIFQPFIDNVRLNHSCLHSIFLTSASLAHPIIGFNTWYSFHSSTKLKMALFRMWFSTQTTLKSMKSTLEESQEQIHTIMIILSLKHVHNLEKVCSDLVLFDRTGVWDKDIV